MATLSYYRSSPVVRTRSATPMTPEVSQRLPLIADKTVNKCMTRSLTSADIPEVCHAKTYYNPARQQVYSRFSGSDWAASNTANYTLSSKERAEAERLRAEAWRTVHMTDQRTRVRQAHATNRLRERVQDIDYWRSELNNEIRAMEVEQENLKEHLRILEVAFAYTARPLSVAEECLMHREKRIGIDQVKDDVERNLIKEVDVIKKCQQQMQRLIEKANIQLKLNRSAQHELEKDLKDKGHAQFIDDKMHQLKNSSPGIGYHPGIELVDNTISIPDSWVHFTQENILRSQRCRADSEKLRGDIDNMLRACANAMYGQFNTVNNAMNTRVHEIIDARNKLQEHFKKTMQEIFDTDNAISLLRKAIADKEAPLKVAQTRLEERTHRLNVEACNDPAMKTLQREVLELRESIRALKDRLRQAEIIQARLAKSRSILENDITVKENSLQIDQKLCLGLRKTFPIDSKVGPIFNMPVAY